MPFTGTKQINSIRSQQLEDDAQRFQEKEIFLASVNHEVTYELKHENGDSYFFSDAKPSQFTAWLAGAHSRR